MKHVVKKHGHFLVAFTPYSSEWTTLRDRATRYSEAEAQVVAYALDADHVIELNELS